MSTEVTIKICYGQDKGIKCLKRGHIPKIFKDKLGVEYRKYFCAYHAEKFYELNQDPYKGMRRVDTIVKHASKERDQLYEEYRANNWRERQRIEKKHNNRRVQSAYAEYDKIIEETQ